MEDVIFKIDQERSSFMSHVNITSIVNGRIAIIVMGIILSCFVVVTLKTLKQNKVYFLSDFVLREILSVKWIKLMQARRFRTRLHCELCLESRAPAATNFLNVLSS